MSDIYQGRRLAAGELPTTSEFQAMLDSVQQSQVLRSSGGMNVTSTPHGTAIDAVNQQGFTDNAFSMFDEAFLGRIVRGGPWPDGSPNNTVEYPDYQDARYWVQEMFVADPLAVDSSLEHNIPTTTKTPESRMAIGPLPSIRESEPLAGPASPDHTAQPSPDTGEHRFYPRRIVTATNLSETVVGPPFDLPPLEIPPPTRGETHILGLDRFQEEMGEVVLVYSFRAIEGTEQYFFSRPPSGGQRFAVVVETFQPPGRTDLVRVQPLREVDDNGSLSLAVDGSPVLIRTWPNTKSMWYHSLTWPATTYDDTTPVVKLSFVRGNWYAEQTLRHELPEIPRGVPFDDCSPPAIG